MRLLVMFFALSGVLLAACGDDDTVTTAGDDDSTSDLPSDDTEYWSVAVTEDGEDRALVDDTRISLRLGDGTIGANLGCNHLGADFSVDGRQLVVGMMSTTEMGCDPERHAQDEWFAEFLGARPTYTVEGDTLVLETDATRIEFVERATLDPDRPLSGTDWVVTGFVTADAAMSMAIDEDGTIRFDEATSTATGFDGCNTFEVPFEVDGGDLRPGAVDKTEMSCPAAEDYQERFHAVLYSEVVHWDVANDTLTLTIDDGRGVTFRAER